MPTSSDDVPTTVQTTTQDEARVPGSTAGRESVAEALRGITDAPAVGVDLGGTNIQIGIVAANGEVLSRAKRKTNAEEGLDAIVGRIVDGIYEACDDSSVAFSDIECVGVGAPGPIDPATGTVLEAVNLRWDNVPLADILRARLGRPVYLDNDVNVAVWGEYTHGAGRGARDLLGAWIGTGVGGGIILGGRLHYGHFFTAGEIGHMITEPGNAPGSRTLEQNCSRTAVVDRIQRLIRANHKSTILQYAKGNDPEKIKSKSVAQAYAAGDELVVEVVDDMAVRLGTALGSFTTMLSLQRIVLGGGLTEAIGQPFVEKVAAAARRNVFPDACRAVEVVASRLEDNAGVVGAAMIAKERAARPA